MLFDFVGTQLTTSYGHQGNAELFSQFGFSLAENPFDTFSIFVDRAESLQSSCSVSEYLPRAPGVSQTLVDLALAETGMFSQLSRENQESPYERLPSVCVFPVVCAV